MKNLLLEHRFIIIITMIIIGSYNISAQFTPDSCLKLLLPLEKYPDFLPPFNPDSVMGDSCYGSPTFGLFFAKHTYHLGFQKNILSPKLIPKDSIVTWSIISDDYPIIKNKFTELENKYGHYYLLRHPNTGENGFLHFPEFFLYFTNYICIDSVLYDLNIIFPDSITCYLISPPNYLIGVNVEIYSQNAHLCFCHCNTTIME